MAPKVKAGSKAKAKAKAKAVAGGRPHRRLAAAIGARRRLGLRRPAGAQLPGLARADSRWERGEVVPLHGLNYSKLIEADGIVVEEDSTTKTARLRGGAWE